MDDHEQVRQLFARYAHALDAADGDAVASLFSDDGVFEVVGQSFKGRAAIAGMVRQYAAAGALSDGRHLTLNSVIALDGRTGVATSDWVAVHANTDGWSILAVGRYFDDLVHKGTWLIQRRRDVIDGPVPDDAAAVLPDA